MEVNLEQKDAVDWAYRGEGAANLVLAYIGSSPAFVCFFSLLHLFSFLFSFCWEKQSFSIDFLFFESLCNGQKWNFQRNLKPLIVLFFSPFLLLGGKKNLSFLRKFNEMEIETMFDVFNKVVCGFCRLGKFCEYRRLLGKNWTVQRAVQLWQCMSASCGKTQTALYPPLTKNMPANCLFST